MNYSAFSAIYPLYFLIMSKTEIDNHSRPGTIIASQREKTNKNTFCECLKATFVCQKAAGKIS